MLIALTSTQFKSVKEKKCSIYSRQSNEAQNNSNSRQNYGDLPALSPGETPWAQGTPEMEQYNSSSRQSYLDQNMNHSRQNEDALIALTSSPGKSVKEKRCSRQSHEEQNNSNSRQNYGDLPAQGRSLGQRTHPRRNKIAIALDTIARIRTSTILDGMIMS